MVWNILVHIVIGILGTELFDWSAQGILYSLLVVCVTQPAEIARQYSTDKNKAAQKPAHQRKAEVAEFNKNFKKELISTLIQNIIMYMAIVLMSAEITRSSGLTF